MDAKAAKCDSRFLQNVKHRSKGSEGNQAWQGNQLIYPFFDINVFKL
jgi:hypothetical protein